MMKIMMKMNPTMTVLVCALAAGLTLAAASAQNPSIIQNTRNTMNAVSNNSTAASNEALGIHQSAPVAGSVGVKTAGNPAPAKSSAAIALAPAATKPAPATAAVKIVPISGVKPVAVAKVKHHAEPKAVLVGVKASSPSSTTTPIATTAPAGDGDKSSDGPVVPDGKYAANGRRDPFISPVVSHAGGSGCSTGKKCLEIGAINLRGVVHGENGFIAVVSNSMNKAYFLRENDPVFNGYVVKITGDSVVFQETLQDRLGKTFTREVVKKITTPAV
jgi:hypothetical protein